MSDLREIGGWGRAALLWVAISGGIGWYAADRNVDVVTRQASADLESAKKFSAFCLDSARSPSSDNDIFSKMAGCDHALSASAATADYAATIQQAPQDAAIFGFQVFFYLASIPIVLMTALGWVLRGFKAR